MEKTFGVSPESFGDLIKDVMSSKQDIKAFAFKTKAMVITGPTSPNDNVST